jgi:hypothetical protein
MAAGPPCHNLGVTTRFQYEPYARRVPVLTAADTTGKDEVLLDVHDVTLGRTSKMRWTEDSEWIYAGRRHR